MTLVFMCLGKIECSGLFCFLFFFKKRNTGFIFFSNSRTCGFLDRKSKTSVIYKCSTNVIYQIFNKREEINLYVCIYIFLMQFSSQNRMKHHLLVFFLTDIKPKTFDKKTSQTLILFKDFLFNGIEK